MAKENCITNIAVSTTNCTLESYELVWPGKQQAKLSILEPLIPLSSNHTSSNNLFIEDDNLNALKYLQQDYTNKIKLIYIDPPYNINSKRFTYQNNFYEGHHEFNKRTGKNYNEISEYSNLEVSERYHSNWLSFMYPRLFLAKDLLSDDGVIFIHIDDNEYHHLRILMDEIFGERNFVATIVWNNVASKNNRSSISITHEYILVYQHPKQLFKSTRNKLPISESQRKLYDQYDPIKGYWKSDPLIITPLNHTIVPENIYPITGPTGKVFLPDKNQCWCIKQEEFEELSQKGLITFGKKGTSVPRKIKYLKDVDGIVPTTWWKWEDVGHTGNAKRELRELFGIRNLFDTPKPIKLIQRILEICTNPNDNHIILDFFAGSCSTAHAVLDMNKKDNGNRRFIMVQKPEELLYSKEYSTIAELGIERIRRVIKKLQSDNQLNLWDKKIDLDFEILKREL